MNKIGSFHEFILEIQQILDCQGLKGNTIPDQHNAKIIKLTFKFPEFLSTH